MDDLLIKGGTILTFNSQASVLKDGWVSISGSKIAALGTGKPPQARQVIDANGKIVMPGLINTHTHAAMVVLRGVADDLPLHDWLFNHIFPIEGKFVSPEFVYWGTKLAAAEMLLSGTTTFNDMYFQPDEIARAASEAGTRAVVSAVAFDLPTRKEPKQILEDARDFISKWTDDSLIVPAVGPHSPYTSSPELLIMMAKLSEERNLSYHIHIAETAGEVADSVKKHGKSPVAYLESLGVLSPRVVAAHCVHLSQDDILIMKKHDVKVAHNPESNMKLASGIAPVVEMAKAGLTVALGTDGAASNNNLNMFEEMRSAALLHKVSKKDSTVLPAKQVLDMATIDGARALGLEDKIGSLEVGKLADIIILDTSAPHMQPIYNIYSHLVYATNGSEVNTVVVNGKIVVKDRHVKSFDVIEAAKQVGEIAEKIRQFSRA